MAIHGYKGGVISATPPTTSVSGASGVWTTDDALQAGANWPVAPALATNSVRLRASATAYLSRTFPTAGNRKTWTWSGWVKRGTIGTAYERIFGGPANASHIYFVSDYLQFDLSDVASGTAIGAIKSSAVYRDPSAWYHIVAVCDTTQATSSNRMKLYVNGTQITALSQADYPSQNYESAINSAGQHTIGYRTSTQGSAGIPYDGYITEVNFIDGQALTPNYFGATDGATGVWQPATYRGTYGTNGFYLPMNVQVQDYSVDYLVVAGGGGGGATRGGGGGAGGLLTSSATLIQRTTYTVTIGAGGAGGTDRNSTPVYPGNDSVFSSVTATGGGKGGNEDTASGTGGSGGGGGGGTAATSGSAGTAGQGYAGGNGNSSTNRPGGGGGGSGGTGGNASGTDGGAGGIATASSITGTSTYYAGGGGGGSGLTGGLGGGTATTAQKGGAGDGGNINVVGGNGTANTGGGAGGGGFNAIGMAGGQGGSGVVILRMLTTNYSGVTTGSPTVTTDGSYTVVKFTSSGSYTA